MSFWEREFFWIFFCQFQTASMLEAHIGSLENRVFAFLWKNFWDFWIYIWPRNELNPKIRKILTQTFVNTCFYSFISSHFYFIIKLFKNSHRSCSVRKVVLRSFAKFTGKHLCQSLFFNKVAVFTSFSKISKITFFTEHLGRLLLAFLHVSIISYDYPDYPIHVLVLICTSSFLHIEAVARRCVPRRACNFIEKRLQQRCFPVKFAKFLRTPFFTEHLWRLFLFSLEALGM